MRYVSDSPSVIDVKNFLVKNIFTPLKIKAIAKECSIQDNTTVKNINALREIGYIIDTIYCGQKIVKGRLKRIYRYRLTGVPA
jgi:hypothetical protein